MRNETSYGIIPLKRDNHLWLFLIVQPHYGWWGFPKGHPEVGESTQETAERELSEETGLKVERYFQSPLLEEKYSFWWKGERIHKTVIYWMAEVKGELSLQAEEIMQALWLPFDEAYAKLTYPEGKNVCLQAQQHLQLLG